MRIVTAHLSSAAPYGQSRKYSVPRNERESDHDYELRTWRNRLHWDPQRDNEVFIPPVAFPRALEDAAKIRSDRIPNKNRQTYTKFFRSAILVPNPVYLGIKREEVDYVDLWVPSQGQRGGGTRVEKRFPVIHQWEADVVFYILTSELPKHIFHATLEDAGLFIGVGMSRPQNGYHWGRWSVESLDWPLLEGEGADEGRKQQKVNA